MKQQSLEASGFETYRKKTRKENFLDEMEQIIPWHELSEAIAPYYPKEPKGAGRKPVGLLRMLKIHFLQHWFELSDPAAEEALYDSRAMRLFVGIDLGKEPVPDETTICKFRHLMEKHNLGRRAVSAGQRLPVREWFKGPSRYDRGCLDYQCTHVHQE